MSSFFPFGHLPPPFSSSPLMSQLPYYPSLSLSISYFWPFLSSSLQESPSHFLLPPFPPAFLCIIFPLWCLFTLTALIPSFQPASSKSLQLLPFLALALPFGFAHYFPWLLFFFPPHSINDWPVLWVLQILCEPKEEKYLSFKLQLFKVPEKTSWQLFGFARPSLKYSLGLGGRIVLLCLWSSGQDKTLLCNLPPVSPGFLWKDHLLCSKWSFSLDNGLGLHLWSRTHGHNSTFQFVEEARLGERRVHLWTSGRLCFDFLWDVQLILLVSHHTDYVQAVYICPVHCMAVYRTQEISQFLLKSIQVIKKTNQLFQEQGREKCKVLWAICVWSWAVSPFEWAKPVKKKSFNPAKTGRLQSLKV